MDVGIGNSLIELRRRIVEKFDAGNWEELGLLTGATELITRHPRLLRSLSWGDEDYSGNVLTVLREMAERNPRTFPIIGDYLNKHFPKDSTYVSAKPSERRITFAPNVFQIPSGEMESDLVAVMMPFAREFSSVYDSIRQSTSASNFRCLRGDDIWEDSTIVQDIFSLIYRAQVVVVDFTGKNPNVMYETGIAHTLGKVVIPISQSLDDVPFDMRHHRFLKYLPNTEGLAKLSKDLEVKLRQFTHVTPPAPIRDAPDVDFLK